MTDKPSADDEPILSSVTTDEVRLGMVPADKLMDLFESWGDKKHASEDAGYYEAANAYNLCRKELREVIEQYE